MLAESDASVNSNRKARSPKRQRMARTHLRLTNDDGSAEDVEVSSSVAVFVADADEPDDGDDPHDDGGDNEDDERSDENGGNDGYGNRDTGGNRGNGGGNRDDGNSDGDQPRRPPRPTRSSLPVAPHNPTEFNTDDALESILTNIGFGKRVSTEAALEAFFDGLNNQEATAHIRAMGLQTLSEAVEFTINGYGEYGEGRKVTN
ncbi:unnamed protein product [Phytophthora fragariaefolia]|uniref:Unnamed protein product n=1 Tax=Phytophthora fragariaefolia TaxID=1490495 RepID=A0A9W6YCE9_9STRA|nr:unnamed protein product [Phytophthora fragariaefolia]